MSAKRQGTAPSAMTQAVTPRSLGAQGRVGGARSSLAWQALWPVTACLVACLGVLATPAAAWDMAGEHRVMLHGRDGNAVQVASVNFRPQVAGQYRFTLTMRHDPFKDFFLSMKEFKCLETPAELFCHVPYPYAQPGTVAADDLRWLEHALLFMFKAPNEFGAKLWNGVYFNLKLTDQGIEGRSQAVDLNRISAPPDQPGMPPFRSALRDDIAPGARWFGRMTIE